MRLITILEIAPIGFKILHIGIEKEYVITKINEDTLSFSKYERPEPVYYYDEISEVSDEAMKYLLGTWSNKI